MSVCWQHKVYFFYLLLFLFLLLFIYSKVSDNKEAQKRSLKSFVSQIPIENQKMIKFLVYFFVTISNNSDKNLMTSENLAAILAPVFFKRISYHVDLTTTQIIKETEVMISFFLLMLEERQFVFTD
jgi:hypothetical protein